MKAESKNLSVVGRETSSLSYVLMGEGGGEGLLRDPTSSERHAPARASMALNRFLLFIAAFCLLPSALVHADPTQEDVFRSISQNVNESADAGKFFAVIAGAVALVLLLAF